MDNRKESSQSKRYRKIGPYLLCNVIGKGAYSVVYQAKKQREKTRYAVKQISLLQVDSRKLQRIHHEINVLTSIKHKNIVALLDYKQTSRNLYLVFEYCKHTDLQAYVQKYSIEKMPQQKVKKIAIQLKNAFQVLRQNKVVHRDLKLANILVTQQFLIKIADFGFAKHLDDNEFFRSYVGTPLTMAPEIMQNRNYNEKCDLWSLGIVIYQLLFGKNPFLNKDRMTKTDLRNAIKGQLKIPNHVSQSAQDLLKKLIVYEPADRISFQDFFRHPWLSQTENQNNLDEELLEQALRAQIKNILLVVNKKKQQKEFLQTKSENLLSYQIIQSVKSSIQTKIMLWINLGKKIMSMQYPNHKLCFLAIAVIMQNLQKSQACNYTLIVNQDKKVKLSKYHQLRQMQKWQMSEYTKRLPGFIERSCLKMIEYMRQLKYRIVFKDDEQLQEKIEPLYLRQLTQQIFNRIEQGKSQNQQLQIFIKIKPFSSSNLYLRISSTLFPESTINMLLKKIKFNIENHKMYKKCSGLFKLDTLHKDEPEDRIYENIKNLLE